MARLALIGCAATVIVALTAVPSRADPINITAGSLVIPSSGPPYGPVNITGTRGFSMVGLAVPHANFAGLFGQCVDPECPPGTRIDFNLNLTGLSGLIGGTMTIEGDRYSVSDSVTAMANLRLHFDGSIVAPEMGPARSTRSAPFSLTGSAYAFAPFGGFAHSDPVFGGGIATVTLVPHYQQEEFGPSWVVDSARFDFEPVPEPSTLLLLGTGALLAARARRSRQSRVLES